MIIPSGASSGRIRPSADSGDDRLAECSLPKTINTSLVNGGVECESPAPEDPAGSGKIRRHRSRGCQATPMWACRGEPEVPASKFFEQAPLQREPSLAGAAQSMRQGLRP